jgi:hypothetical protein
MMDKISINTGTPRNVNGHIISGTLASGAIASAINYNAYNKAEISKQHAIQNSIKLALQGGIATGSAIAATNYLGKNNFMGMISAISLGAFGVYAIEKLNEKWEQKNTIACDVEEEQNLESKED